MKAAMGPPAPGRIPMKVPMNAPMAAGTRIVFKSDREGMIFPNRDSA